MIQGCTGIDRTVTVSRFILLIRNWTTLGLNHSHKTGYYDLIYFFLHSTSRRMLGIVGCHVYRSVYNLLQSVILSFD